MRHLLLAILLIACTDPMSPASGDGRLNAARTAWAQNGYAHYRFELHWLCECSHPANGRWIVVEVENGAAVEAYDRQTLEPLTGAELAAVQDVEGLFDVIADAFARSAAQVIAVYDDLRGYPHSLSIDFQANVTDDEIFAEVEALVEVP